MFSVRACAIFCLLFTTKVFADTFAVIPFANASSAPNLDWVGESVSEAVRESLDSEFKIVIDRSERHEAMRRLGVRSYIRLTKASLFRIGEELDADQIVFGRFEFSPTPPATGSTSKGQLRVWAQVLSLKQLRLGTEYSTSGPIEQLTLLQNQVAWNILQSTSPNLAFTEVEFRESRPQVRVDAMENYTRGLLAQSAETRLKLFSQAYKLDLRFSQPCFQLGLAYWQKQNYRNASEWLQRVSPADARYREARFLLGLCAYYQANFVEAAKAFAYVADKVPLSEVFNNLAVAQMRLNDGQAQENLERAVEGDPNDPAYLFNLAYLSWRQGAFPRAVQQFQQLLERVPDDVQAKQLLARCEKQSAFRLSDQGMERLKQNYEESAYRQLKSALERAQ